MAKYSIVINIPERLKPTERKNLADAIITHIQGRTMAGLDKNNERFPRYTKEYAALKGSNKVDLVLSGEMLSEMKLIRESKGKLEIGFSGSRELVGKVEGNILGTYGNDTPIPGKARDFLGIEKSDLDVLIDSYEEDLEEDLSDKEIDTIARRAAKEILGNVEFETDVTEEAD